MSALDTQIGGGHYKGMKIQPMEYSMANGLDACQHTAIKYISRFRDKGGIQDLEKAKHCIDMLIEFEQKRLSEETISTVVEDILSDGPTTAALKVLATKATQEQDPYGPRDAEGWYAWNGDETMRPAGMVEYIMVDDLPYKHHSGPSSAEGLRWSHDHIGGDIVKWRPYQSCANASKGCVRPKLATGPYCDQCELDL